jgi:hypothetical protein
MGGISSSERLAGATGGRRPSKLRLLFLGHFGFLVSRSSSSRERRALNISL